MVGWCCCKRRAEAQGAPLLSEDEHNERSPRKLPGPRKSEDTELVSVASPARSMISTQSCETHEEDYGDYSDAYDTPRRGGDTALSPDREKRKSLRGSIRMSGDREADCAAWVQEVTGDERGDRSFHEWLRDGLVLCQLANAIKPGIIKKVHEDASGHFKQSREMENVSHFICACRDLGVHEKDVFSTVDLYEAKNLKSVQMCLFNLGSASRHVQGFAGPYLGVAQVELKGLDKKRDRKLAQLRPGGEHSGGTPTSSTPTNSLAGGRLNSLAESLEDSGGNPTSSTPNSRAGGRRNSRAESLEDSLASSPARSPEKPSAVETPSTVAESPTSEAE